MANEQLTLEGIGSCIATLGAVGKFEFPLDEKPRRGDRIRVTTEYVVTGVGDDEDFDNEGMGTGEASLLISTQVLPGYTSAVMGKRRAEVEAEWEKRVLQTRNVRNLAG